MSKQIRKLGPGFTDFSQYYSCPELAKRGWTPGSISKFLGDPDAIRPNPVYKSGAPMKLYFVSRVMVVEDSDAFQLWKTKTAAARQKISENSTRIQEVRRQKLLQYIAAINIPMPEYPCDELRAKAILHYENLWSSREDYDRVVTKDAPDEFIHRIMVNMLRHGYTRYDSEIKKLFGKTGKDLAYALLRNKILDAIGKVYPFLSDECNKQKID